MSKTCEVCNRPYSDELAECPHCAGPVEVLDEDAIEIVEEAPDAVALPVEPDSAIDLGMPALPSDSSSGSQSGESGISEIAWASLVEEAPTPAEPAPALFDDPADAHLLRDAGDVPLAAPVEADAPLAAPVEPAIAQPPAHHDDEDALASDLDAVRNIFGGDASASFARHVPSHEASPADDDSALNLLAPDADAPQLAAEAPAAPPENVESGIDLSAADVVEEAPAVSAHEAATDASESGIDVTGAELEQEVVAEAAGPPPAPDSGIAVADLADAGQPAALPAGAAVPADSGIDLAAIMDDEGPVEELDAVEVVDSGVALGAGPESAIDLSGVQIVDSGVNLADAEVTAEPPSDPSGGGLGVRPISDVGVDLSGEEMAEAGIEKDTPDGSESGRDLIAEEVESGVNLSAEEFDIASLPSVETGADSVDEIVVGESGTALAAGRLPSEAEEVDLTERSSPEVESSAVDLGASATFPVAPSEAPPAEASGVETTRPYDSHPKSIHGEEEITPSEVNLGGRHDRADSGIGGDYFDETGGSALNVADEEPAVDEVEEPAAELDEKPVAEEEAPEEESEEEVAPARAGKPKKEKRRSTAGAWMAGTFMGGLIGAAVCLGLWLFNIEPPKEWRTMAAGWTGKQAPGENTTPGNGTAPPPAAMTLADKVGMVKGGDLDRAKQANIEQADETKSDQLAARGEYRVRSFLQQAAAGKAPLKPDDPALQAGIQDLETAAKDNADAAFYLGVAKEATNDLPGAQKAYSDGLERFKNDAAQKERFEAALNRVAAEQAARPAGMGRAEPAAEAAYLALLLTGLQPPPADPAAPPAPADQAPVEAGSAFWRAVRLAHDGQYSDAVNALKQAADVHVKRRFTVLGKAQNPNSDPTEEIFLRSCDELEKFWQLQDKLRTAGYLDVAKGKDAAKAFDDLLAQNKDLNDKVGKATTAADALKKDLETATKDAADAKKEAETTKKELGETKTALDAAKADAEAKKKDLAASEKKAADLADKLKLTEEAVAKRDEALKAVADALKPKFLKPEADEAAVLPAVKETARLAAIADPVHRIRDLEAETAGLKNTLGQRWRPEQMLTYWMPLLRERGRKDLAGDAVIDADRVLADAAASPADKARAHAVKGVALRDQEKYAEAKVELEQAKAGLPKEDGEWMLDTEAALQEASDPSAYFAGRAETFHKEGRTAQALAFLDRALATAGPGAKDGLLLERAAWRFDAALARGKGRAASDDPDFVAARKDADEAAKGGGAEALFLAGRIAEEAGQPDAALADYRKALAAHAALDADGARYRAALARVLILPKQPAPGGGKVGKAGRTPALDVLVALLTVGLQPGDLPGGLDPATQEALKLADEILSAKPGDVPFEARAQAYAIKGLWTQALITYAEGLRPLLGPEHANGLMAIIEGHPALRRPTVLTVADPLEAEKHYAAGLHWYNDHDWARAEKEFFTAVENDGQDARYYYFLGLARLMQGDRDAAEDFDQGARLEHQNRPPRAAVSAALERVQGAARGTLNDARDRPR